LYLINQLYACAGIGSRWEEYLQNFTHIETRYRDYFGDDFAERARSSIPELSELQQYLAAYQNKDEDALYMRRPQSLSTPWVDNTVEFMRRLHWLRQYPLPVTQPRLFVSHHHDVAESTTLRKQIEDHIRESYPDRMLALSVTGAEDAPWFRERIKFLIWQADCVFCIVPLTPKKTGSQETKEYTWLLREAEYAVHLGKRVVFLCEEGLEIEDFVRRITKQPIDFLVPPLGNAEEAERLEAFADQCRHNLHETYKLGGDNTSARRLDGRVVERLQKEHRTMLASRHESLILGYLSHFSLATRELLLGIHYLARSPKRMSKADLAVALVAHKFRDCEHKQPLSLQEAENAITAAWEHISKRSLTINGRSYRAMSLHGRKTYSLQINSILEALDSGASRLAQDAAGGAWWQERSLAEIRELEERLLKQTCATPNRF